MLLIATASAGCLFLRRDKWRKTEITVATGETHRIEILGSVDLRSTEAEVVCDQIFPYYILESGFVGISAELNVEFYSGIWVRGEARDVKASVEVSEVTLHHRTVQSFLRGSSKFFVLFRLRVVEGINVN